MLAMPGAIAMIGDNYVRTSTDPKLVLSKPRQAADPGGARAYRAVAGACGAEAPRRLRLCRVGSRRSATLSPLQIRPGTEK